jgi:hypothetical protein
LKETEKFPLFLQSRFVTVKMLWPIACCKKHGDVVRRQAGLEQKTKEYKPFVRNT